jgi:predicted GIY-YIG superfamily endonuclease
VRIGEDPAVGVTECVATRLAQHTAGVSKWTKRYAGSRWVVWQQGFASLGEARQFEITLKRRNGTARSEPILP